MIEFATDKEILELIPAVQSDFFKGEGLNMELLYNKEYFIKTSDDVYRKRYTRDSDAADALFILLNAGKLFIKKKHRMNHGY
ncbi:MAG: hypothetical protein ACKVPJ_13645 [Chitinophagales bacterium]